MDRRIAQGGDAMSFPTEEELKQAFASITDPEKRDAAFHTIYIATKKFRGLVWHFKDSSQSFDDVRGEAIRKILARKKPISADRPYAYLKRTLARIYLDEIRRVGPLPAEYHENLDEDQNEESVSSHSIHQTLGTAIMELIPTGTGQIDDAVEHLCTQILPGNCGRMKGVPDKVRAMYHLFDEVRESDAPANFSPQERKEHERVRLKVEEVVQTHVEDEKEKALWLGFVKNYLRLRSPTERKHPESD